MQVLDNEIKGKVMRIRTSGRRTELLLRLPNELRDTLNFKPGDQVQCYWNHRGEVLFRPVSTTPLEADQLPGAGVGALLPDHEEALR